MAERVQLPQSGGGLVRYSEEPASRIQMGPMTVVVMIAVVIFVALVLHFLTN